MIDKIPDKLLAFIAIIGVLYLITVVVVLIL